LAATTEPDDAATRKPPQEVKGARNLVLNGDFEAGDDSPTGWQTVDGLTAFWEKDEDPKHGKVIRFDTDVYQAQAYSWWVKIAKGAKAKDAPKKTPTSGDKYDALAGLDGVWFLSDFIAVAKGKAYSLTLDVKGPMLLAWLVGYAKKESPAFGADASAFQEYLQEKVTGRPRDAKRGFEGFIHKYVWKGHVTAGGSDQWKTYPRNMQVFRPTAHTPEVKFVRVLLLPTWPPATYRVDNIRLVEVEDPAK
jgi:hypothetical protein